MFYQPHLPYFMPQTIGNRQIPGDHSKQNMNILNHGNSQLLSPGHALIGENGNHPFMYHPLITDHHLTSQAPGNPFLPPSAFFNQNYQTEGHNEFSLIQFLDNPLHPIYSPMQQIPASFMTNSNNLLSFPQPNIKSPMDSFIQTFKNKDGSLDFNKMFSTAGQLMGTINQFSTLIKGFSQIFKR